MTADTTATFFAWLAHPLAGRCHEPRDIGDGLYAALKPFGFTCAIIVGAIGDRTGYADRWCYEHIRLALDALEAWVEAGAQGEPQGWHRHPDSGRRVALAEGEYDRDGKIVPIGTMYHRR
jgi:hypothetical protein